MRDTADTAGPKLTSHFPDELVEVESNSSDLKSSPSTGWNFVFLSLLVVVGLASSPLFSDWSSINHSSGRSVEFNSTAATPHRTVSQSADSDSTRIDSSALANLAFDSHEHPNWDLQTIDIDDIRVGIRVPAHNPGGQGIASLAAAYGVSESDLRSLTFHLENSLGEMDELVITRPRDWILHQVQLTENVESEIAEQGQGEQPNWVEGALDALAVTSSFQADPVAATLGFLETTFAPLEALQAWHAVAAPSSSIATLAVELQQLYLEQTLADVEQAIATADWLQAVDANELTGIGIYLQLPELEIDAWATLAGVGPARSEIPEPEKIDPASHRLLKLVAQREDGSRTKIELIRSVDWIRDSLGESALHWANRTASQRLHLQIPELRLNNYADVLAIESCPSILDGPGEVVTATYHTDRAPVIDLQFFGLKDPLGATPSHPFWSVTRQSFIPAGELVLGEEVVALEGQTFRLTSLTPRAGPEPVFNLEVANEHTYYVSRAGLLVHNAGRGKYLTEAGRQGKLAPKKMARPENIQRANKKLPTEEHHFATNKNKQFTLQFEEIANKYGLKLNGSWNKYLLPNRGRHPNKYHEFVQENMQNASREAGNDVVKFLNLFERYVKEPVRLNPLLLRKIGWQ